jgi:acetyl-CoA carboxylase beta subunit
MIVDRREMRNTIIRLLNFMLNAELKVSNKL